MSLGRKILFIDAYDSFSHNIIALLKAECGVQVVQIHIDDKVPKFEEYVTQFCAVVCGPGPGHPACFEDVGLFRKVWALADDRLLPVLGICLGFQSLAYDFGAAVVRLPKPRHGIKTPITSASTSIFEGLPHFNSVQYHSLYVKLHLKMEFYAEELWIPSLDCPEIQPLAWDLASQSGPPFELTVNPPTILMAAKHTTKPFFGIQFHPESICSDLSAKKIIVNWWREVQAYSSKVTPQSDKMTDRVKVEKRNKKRRGCVVRCGTKFDPRKTFCSKASSATSLEQEKAKPQLVSVTHSMEGLSIPRICDALNLTNNELIVLDCEMRQHPDLGGASVIGIISPETTKIIYHVDSREVRIRWPDRSVQCIDLKTCGRDVFWFLKEFMSNKAIEIRDDRAFCGGLIGYISYEACLETIGVGTSKNRRPDMSFAFIERSILIDHKSRTLYVQGLMYDPSDDSVSRWVDKTSAILGNLSSRTRSPPPTELLPLSPMISQRTLPDEFEYKSKVAECKEEIEAGRSYELCLTDQTSIILDDHVSSWDMYQKLRSLNPAHFGAYFHMHGLTLLSTSPERFMKWSRFGKTCAMQNNGPSGGEQVATCQFRPMKGTVRKTFEMADGSTHHRSYDEAAAILSTPKEQAENLMILDLIRHDLYSVCRDVFVPDLMVIEDHGSVYQMISVIEGTISKPLGCGQYENRSGIDCLAASLPPGSMTGAPKKRSCQLLQNIEKKPRSVYSGVLGYIDVTGKGDFSVIIRSIYHWEDEWKPGSSKWNIGAGGAVTALSTEDGEWEEMLTKLQSTYGLFDSRA